MKMHHTDALCLVFGLLFLGIAALWLISHLVTLNLVTIGWLVAGGLVVLGALGIAHAVAGNRRHADDLRR